VSVVLSIFSIERCTFGVANATTDPSAFVNATANPSAHIRAWGLFTTPVYNVNGHIQGCIPHHSSMELEASLKTAQAFGILLVVSATTIFVGLSLVQFFLEWGTLTIYYSIRVLLPCAFVCQLLAFASFGSKFCDEIVVELGEGKGTVPATCTPGTAGIVAIFNMVAMMMMMMLMNAVIPPEHPMFQLYGTGNSVTVIGNQCGRKNQDMYDHPKRPRYQSNRQSTKRGRASHHPRDSSKRRQMEQYTMREPQRPGREKIRTTIVNGPNIRKAIKEITHPDGSQTITTTIERHMFDTSDADIIDCEFEATTLEDLLSYASDPGIADSDCSENSNTTSEEEDSIMLDDVP
jgi:hypothetical protein